MSCIIRPATLADSDRLAEILADGWARAYSSFMPAHIVKPRSDRAARRVELREFVADEFDPATESLFVHDRNGHVDGFVHAVLGDKNDLGTGGYVSLLYVDAGAERRGLGRSLLAEAADWLSARTDLPIAIVAFEDNPFHPFYAHIGGRLAKTTEVKIEDFTCRSVSYLWDNATALKARVG